MSTHQLELNFDAPAPADVLHEISRRLGMSVASVKSIASQYYAPILAPECFILWRLARQVGAKAQRREKMRGYNRVWSRTEKGKNYARARRKSEKWQAAQQRARSKPSNIARKKVQQREFAQTEAGRAIKTRYAKKNRAKIQARHRARIKQDLAYKIRRHLASRLRHLLSAAGAHKTHATMVLVGCSADFLWSHLEQQFKPGMTRQNYGKAWHIDHRIAMKAQGVDLRLEEHQRLVMHWTNLQPMWGPENLRKGNKITQEHQLPVLLEGEILKPVTKRKRRG